MFDSFYDYFMAVYEHLELASAFFSIIKYMALGFALSLVLVIVCVKCKFFRRQNKLWNIATNLYFLFIPIVCIGAGAAFGLLEHCKVINDKAVSSLIRPVKQEMVDRLRDLPQEIRVADLKTKTKSKTGLQIEDAATADNQEDVIDKQPSLFREWLLSEVVIARIAAATGVDKKKVDQLRKQDVVEIFEGDFLDDALSQRIRGMIQSYQNKALLIVLLLFLIPTADTLIARRLEKRGRRDAAGGNGV